jgi:hypothetical protein
MVDPSLGCTDKAIFDYCSHESRDIYNRCAPMIKESPEFWTKQCIEIAMRAFLSCVRAKQKECAARKP